MKEAGGGSIVNMSSVAGKHGFPFRSPYSAVKYGVIGITETWARELGPSNIRVNAIQPGVVEGARIEAVISARAEIDDLSGEVAELRAAAAAATAAGSAARTVVLATLTPIVTTCETIWQSARKAT